LVKPLDIKVRGEWIEHYVLRLDMGGYIQADCTFAKQWPEPPAEFMGEIDVGAEIVEKRPTEQWYRHLSFHGPQYHSSIEQKKICQRGMVGLVEKKAGKGSTLDILGQQLGLFLHITQTKDPISFPVQLKEIHFYANMLDQAGTFENTIILKRLNDSVAVMDAVLKRNGKIWAVARDYKVQRFLSTPYVWQVILDPQRNVLAQEISPGVYFYGSNLQNNVIELLAKRYLTTSEKGIYEKLDNTNKKREYVISNIALKDAVRVKIAGQDEPMPYPIEFSCIRDDSGRPVLQGQGGPDCPVSNLSVSLAHKATASVAYVSERPVGVDLERIEEKSEEFIGEVFTAGEIELLRGLEMRDAVTRFWVAKEAYSKMIGEGLRGRPKRFEVTSVEEDVLFVEGVRVRTQKIDNEYFVGWTID
jgi:phosphopantetheinyl transferase